MPVAGCNPAGVCGPVTEEGILSALAGFVAVWGGLLVLAGFIRSLRRSRRRASAPVAVQAPRSGLPDSTT